MKTTRRRFLLRSGSLLAGSMIFSYAEANRSFKNINKRKNVTVGAHPWIYAAKLPEYDISPVLDKIFQDVKYAGFDGVELMHQPLRDHNTTLIIREERDRYDLPVIGTSYGANMWDKTKHQEILEDVENIVTNLAKVGGRTFGTSVGNAPARKTEEQLDAQAELLKKLISICNNKGVILNLHNHTYEVEDDMYDLRGTLKRIPDVKLGPDLNWLERGGVDPIKFLKEFKSQVVFMHLRDQSKNGKWSESIGEGDGDYKAIGKTIKNINFKGDLVIELAHENDFVPTRPIKESLKMSREFVKETMGY